MSAATRSERRKGIAQVTRLQLLEDDVDTLESDLERGMSALSDRLARILWAMVGLLISVSTACILLVLNLAVKR